MVEVKTIDRLAWWLVQGAEIICGGSQGNDKAPLRRDGRDGGSYNEDFHTALETLPANAASYGLRFTATTSHVCLDVDIKDCHLAPGVTPEAVAFVENILADLGDTYRERSTSGGAHVLYTRPDGWVNTLDRGKVVLYFADLSAIELFLTTGWCRTAPTAGFDIINDVPPTKIGPDALDRLVTLIATWGRPAPERPRIRLDSYCTARAGESMMEYALRHLEDAGGVEAAIQHYGWQQLGHGAVWRRPGWEGGHAKGTNGKSASINASGRLIVWTSATPFADFQSSTPSPTFDALDVIAVYEHGGDRVAAARRIWSQRPTASTHASSGSPFDDDDEAESVGDEPSSVFINWPEFWNKDHQTEDWLVKPLIPRGRAVSVYGAGGST